MKVKFNWGFLIGIPIVSAMGGYLFGFDFAVITGELPFLREQFGLDAYWEGFTKGSLALGCMMGCLIAGNIADRYGRKPGLLTAAALFFFSSLSMSVAPGLGFFISSRFVAGIGVGMASVLSPMTLVDRWGRKPLMLSGAAGLSVLYVIIGIILLRATGNGLSLFILMAIGVYAMSLAPLTWVLISEIFPNQVRGAATSIVVLSLWFAYFILVVTFPALAENYGPAKVFSGYAGICVLGFVFILARVKETKGKSLEKIEKDYIRKELNKNA